VFPGRRNISITNGKEFSTNYMQNTVCTIGKGKKEGPNTRNKENLKGVLLMNSAA
jgi:hypothetical protein